MADAWYYSYNGANVGPLTVEDLIAALRCFDRPRDVYVWQKGMNDWEKAGARPELQSFFDVPPPPPPTSGNSPRRQEPPLEPKRAFHVEVPIEEMKARVVEEKKVGMFGKFAGWSASLFGAVVGIAFARVFGAAFWVPALCVVSFWFLLKFTTVRPELKPILAMTGGHFLWFVVGMVFVSTARTLSSDDFVTIFVELPVNITLLSWVIWKQSRTSVVGLMAYQGISIVINFVMFESTASNQQIYLVVHIIMRVIELCCAIYALTKMHKGKLQTAEA